MNKPIEVVVVIEAGCLSQVHASKEISVLLIDKDVVTEREEYMMKKVEDRVQQDLKDGLLETYW